MTPHTPETSGRIDSHAPQTDIMTVDFSDETIIFKKMNILAQSGAFALSQTNAMPASVLALLRGGREHN